MVRHRVQRPGEDVINPAGPRRWTGLWGEDGGPGTTIRDGATFRVATGSGGSHHVRDTRSAAGAGLAGKAAQAGARSGERRPDETKLAQNRELQRRMGVRDSP